VERGDGGTLVWLNNQAYARDELPANVAILPPASQGRLRIVDLETGRAYTVRPGQVLNLTRGLLFESYQMPASGGAADQDQGQGQ